MSQMSTKPVSGFRDFLPNEARRRRRVFAIIERTFEEYGFDPLDTPTMERLSTLLGKYGEEGDQLIFKVLKRGQKLEKAIQNNPDETSLADAGLRYDLTVPLARIYAQYPNEFPRIFKRYQIAPVWRADRPQKGRYREFIQCDVDIIGSESPLAEVEVIGALTDILQRLDFHEFVIHINHRDLLFATISAAGISDNSALAAITALDKLDKIGVDGVKQELEELELPGESIDTLLAILTKIPVAPHSNDNMLQHLAEVLPHTDSVKNALAQIREIVRLIASSSAAGCVALDPFLARGLSYYTGPIFEIRSPDFAGSIGGGGRYDKLIGMFSGRDVPAVGFSLGIERILMLLEERDPDSYKKEPAADILITLWNASFADKTIELARELRSAGFRVDTYCGEDKYGKQFSYADERNIPFTLMIAPEEVEKKHVKVKNMVTSEQTEVPRDEIVEWFKWQFQSVKPGDGPST